VEGLDDPSRLDHLRATIRRKPALRAFYAAAYVRYAQCIARARPGGGLLELGSGGGFARELIPDLITSDIVAYDGVDRIVDATRLPFAEASLSFIGMLNVFHHIPDVAAFLDEARRCLLPGGRVLIVDQHRGILSTPILRYLHHEPFDDRAPDWRFASSGPLSGANGALAWMVFVRDRQRLAHWPDLRVVGYTPHTPLTYFLAGGLKRWTLLPGHTMRLSAALDAALLRVSPELGSFVDVELVRA
jgi:SAM-dependent methyltransferase